MHNNYAPILIPTLNRYLHLKRLIESLKENDESKYTELVIGLDYPPQERYRKGYEEVKEYVYNISGFRKVTILAAKQNVGPSRNLKACIDYVYSAGYSCYICSEDDNVVSPNFLSYMNWGLRNFKDDKTILSMCAYRRNIPMDKYRNSYFIAPWYTPYGSATWCDRDNIRQEERDFSTMKQRVEEMSFIDILNTKKMYIASGYLLFMKKKFYYGDFCNDRACEYRGMKCVFPTIPLVKTLGADGSGIHGASDDVYISEVDKVIDNRKVFIPEVLESKLYNDYIQNIYDKEMAMINKKAVGKYLYHVVKFIIYKLTGKIICLKGKY